MAPEGSQPQFQHSENWPSIFSSQFLQTQIFLTEARGAKVFAENGEERQNQSKPNEVDKDGEENYQDGRLFHLINERKL